MTCLKCQHQLPRAARSSGSGLGRQSEIATRSIELNEVFMHKQFIQFAFCLAVCALLVVTQAQAQKDKSQGSHSKTAAMVNKASSTGQCKTPRPPNRGCKIACKPCAVPVCENGKWQYEKIEIDKEQCRPHQNPGGGACTIGPTDYCPPSCKSCIRK